MALAYPQRGATMGKLEIVGHPQAISTIVLVSSS
ncbi:hypothetical protein ABID19_005078 [Mesorhizobium robiniae]|uniref:Uncharacterized protein n=1 Tax=Mesorhizobium robiniae TaxID=559315 RepID=A0ABV2GUQ3_9HYPH